MQDNALYSTKVTITHLAERKKNSMIPNPPVSPDINPTEYWWPILKRNMKMEKIFKQKDLWNVIKTLNKV